MQSMRGHCGLRASLPTQYLRACIGSPLSALIGIYVTPCTRKAVYLIVACGRTAKRKACDFDYRVDLFFFHLPAYPREIIDSINHWGKSRRVTRHLACADTSKKCIC